MSCEIYYYRKKKTAFSVQLFKVSGGGKVLTQTKIKTFFCAWRNGGAEAEEIAVGEKIY